MLLENELETRLGNLEEIVEVNHQSLSLQIKQGLDLAHYARRKNVKELKDNQKIIEQKVDNLETKVNDIDNRLKVVEQDVKILKDDVKVLKDDVKDLKLSQSRMENKMDSMFEYMKSKDEKVDLLVEYLQNTLKKD